MEPSEVAYVCPGGQLTLTCNANASFLEWSVTVPHYQITKTRLLSNTGTAKRRAPIIINSTTFNITRNIDESLNLPLISMISTDNVTARLNGTVIGCSEILIGEIDMIITLSTSIHIINDGAGHGTFICHGCFITLTCMIRTCAVTLTPPIVARSEQFGMDGVTVILEWSQENNGTSHNVSVVPLVAIWSTGSTRVQLTVLYNTLYNVSVVATLCGRHNATTTVELSYGKCLLTVK